MRAPLLLLAALSGCRSVQPEATYPGNELAGSVAATSYSLKEGDVLRIRFPAYPQWDSDVVVQPDGMASVPLVGNVLFRGATIDELEQELMTSLGSRVRSPRVELAVKELHPRLVYVGGEVDSPGMVEIEGPQLTLLEAIFSRGGPLRASARLDTVVLSRTDGSGARVSWTVDALALVKGTQEAVLLLPGDVILVPNRPVNEANLFVKQFITDMIPGGGNLLASLILLSVTDD